MVEGKERELCCCAGRTCLAGTVAGKRDTVQGTCHYSYLSVPGCGRWTEIVVSSSSAQPRRGKGEGGKGRLREWKPRPRTPCPARPKVQVIESRCVIIREQNREPPPPVQSSGYGPRS
jgi:hypothetical protein